MIIDYDYVLGISIRMSNDVSYIMLFMAYIYILFRVV